MPIKNRSRKIQVIFFFIGFVLLFVLAFTLGIIIGKGLGGSRYVERNAGDQTQTIADKNTAPPAKETEGTTDSAVVNEQTASQSEDEGLKIPEKEILLKEAPKQAQNKSAADKAVEKTEPEKVPAPTEAMKDELELKETPTAESNLKETRVAKIEKKTEQSPSSIRLPETDPGGKFTVQLGSFKSREMAFNLERKLSSRGYPSFVRKAVIPGKGEWYRVRVGTFNDKRKAESYGKILKSRVSFLKDVYVTSND